MVLRLILIAALLLTGPAFAREALPEPPDTSAVSAVVLEYKLDFADYYYGSPADAETHPLNLLRAAAADWAARRGSALELRLPWITSTYVDPPNRYRATVELWVDADAPRRAELIAALHPIAGPPERTLTQAGYRWEKAPRQRWPERRIVVNGRPATLAELTDAEYAALEGLLDIMPWDPHLHYIANMRISERFPVAPVVSVRFGLGGALVIRDHADALPTGGAALPSYFDMWSVLIPATEAQLPHDPVEMLTRRLPETLSWTQRDALAVGDFNRRGMRCAYDGVDAPLRAALEAGLAQFTARYPELADGAELDAALETESLEGYWSATLWMYNPRLRRELAADLSSAAGRAPFKVPQEPRPRGNEVVVLGSTSGSPAPHNTGSGAQQLRLPMHWIAWTLTPDIYQHLTEAEQSRIPVEVQSHALAQYEAMLAAFTEWTAAHPELQSRVSDHLALYLEHGPQEIASVMHVTDPLDQSKPGVALHVLARFGLPLQVQLNWYGEDLGLLEDLNAALSDAAGKIRPDFPGFMQSMPQGVL